MYKTISVPDAGERIAIREGVLHVPDQPIIPYVEGDGTGPDIWRATVRVVDSAVLKAYGGKRKIHWVEVLVGEKAFNRLGEWLPDETLKALDEFKVSIKGPLTTPVGGGIRSLNVALRQKLDLYACVRPVRYFEGVPSPVKRPEEVDMIIFRENTEDVYAGIEWMAGTADARKVRDRDRAVALQTPLLLLHRDARPVADELIRAGERVEQSRLAAVRIARQRDANCHKTVPPCELG